MRKSAVPATLLIGLAAASVASAQASGTLTITATVESSIAVTIDVPDRTPPDRGRLRLIGMRSETIAPPAVTVQVRGANASAPPSVFAQLDPGLASRMASRSNARVFGRSVGVRTVRAGTSRSSDVCRIVLAGYSYRVEPGDTVRVIVTGG